MAAASEPRVTNEASTTTLSDQPQSLSRAPRRQQKVQAGRQGKAAMKSVNVGDVGGTSDVGGNSI